MSIEPIGPVGPVTPVYGVSYAGEAPAARQPAAEAAGTQSAKISGPEECQTCSNRRYQDGSNDPGVSMKSPTNLTPSQAATAVYAHEREHYTRNAAKAEEEGREVLSNTIRVFTAVCPECGKVYVSGGETNTVTRKVKENESFALAFFEQTVGPHRTGRTVDERA